jgi:hypothetical protein
MESLLTKSAQPYYALPHLLKVYADILHSSVKENFANLKLCISSWIVSMNLPILDKKKKQGWGGELISFTTVLASPQTKHQKNQPLCKIAPHIMHSLPPPN